uniref:Uncharacterized protein n=1 Tax=Anguilla anguilla TaxID=7936 RepID=A0A0E9XLC3_ANGAN
MLSTLSNSSFHPNTYPRLRIALWIVCPVITLHYRFSKEFQGKLGWLYLMMS